MVYILLADGFEEVEALTPADMLRRSGVEVALVGVGAKQIVGARGIKVIADITEQEMQPHQMQMLILPGGYPGYVNLDQSAFVHHLIDTAVQQNCYIAAICGAPSILGKRGDLKGKKACCYPGMEQTLSGATVCYDAVCVDEKFVTSRSAATAMEFSMTLVQLLCGEQQKDKLMHDIVLEKSSCPE